jgi:hypothetical protein
MRGFRASWPSPALVVSIIALVIALGGTSYAAFSVPRNSVGSPQLRNDSVSADKVRNGAVTTNKIRNGAVTGAKIARNTITANQINFGTFGTVPAATQAGHATDADSLGGSPASAYQQKILWARVAPDGTLTAGSGATSSGLLATGDYEVVFDRPVTGCAYEATIGSSLVSNNNFDDAGAGLIYTEPRKNNANGVFVATLAVSTKPVSVNATDNAFHLTVIC